MNADVASFVALLDEQEARVSGSLGDAEDGALHADGGQTLFNALPDAERRALVHLALLARGARRWPGAALIASVAEHHGADVGAVLCGMGWTPAPGRVLTPLQRECLAVARQVLVSISLALECNEPADLTG